jgi:hypothetical protein
MLKTRETALFALMVAGMFSAGCDEAVPPDKQAGGRVADIRQPAVAGQFYPGTKAGLSADVKARLDKAPATGLPAEGINGILVPHAGYVFSADTAAVAYKALIGAQFDIIVILGPPHRAPVPFAAVGAYDAFRTPLGDVPVAKDAAAALINAGVPFTREAHEEEHDIEVQLPFIQTLFPGTPILPILVGTDQPEEESRLAAVVFKVLKDKKALVVISSDLSHYPDADTARASDTAFLKAVESFDVAKVRDTISFCETTYRDHGLVTAACGQNALLTGMLLLGMMETSGAKLLDYRNSGDTPVYGDKARVVGYGAVAFFRKEAPVKQDNKEQKLSKAARKELLTIARRAVEAAVNGQPAPEITCKTPELQVKRGVFVTLKNHGDLRGCLGIFEGNEPLWLQIRDMARDSATEDPRFVGDRITPKELKEVDIEISVLSELKPTKDPLSIRLGIDGIYIKKGWHSGVYLPQVATETGWTKEQFLSHCCNDKAGLSPDAWKDPGTQVLTFTAEVFGEKEEEGGG